MTSGTAICGGSAIAAISPVIKAKKQNDKYCFRYCFFSTKFYCVVRVSSNWTFF
ncbi:putative sulfate exporter family transporter [Mesonia maritima]|uniref:putative sulfate exporter family transporter n=1 Tax=Mesonia maritima TaxID=1793873 RepID=UPI003626E9D0